MSVSSEITRINNNIAAAYTVASDMGATLPEVENSANLADCVSSIPSGGSSPVITSLNVTPTTSAQTITAPSGTDGYSPVNVAAVTAAIDSDIKASNIKSGVSILGVTGTVTELNGETRTATLTSSAGNTFTPSSGKNAITSITVTPNNQARSVTPSTSSQTLSVNSGYSGNGTISVSAVTSSIDANIQAGNIKKDVQILGVTGTYEGSGGGSPVISPLTITPTTSAQTITAPSGTDGYSPITVEPIICVDCLPLGHPAGGALNYAYSYNTSTMIKFVSYATSTLSSNIFGNYLRNCSTLVSFSMPNLVTVNSTGLQNVCYGSSGLTEVNLPMLQTINASGMESAFRGTKITQFNLPSLTTTTGTSSSESLCRDCTSLISVNLPKLTTVGNYGLSSAFNGDTKLTTINMPKVNSLDRNAFRYMLASTKVTNLSFPALKSTSFGSYTNQFTYMLSGVSNCTVHFPSNLRSVIGSWSDVTSGFGGTNTTVLFDLPATS